MLFQFFCFSSDLAPFAYAFKKSQAYYWNFICIMNDVSNLFQEWADGFVFY